MEYFRDSDMIQELGEITSVMYGLGWNERNGGNISWLIEEEKLERYSDIKKTVRTIELGMDAGDLAGKIFLVTGAGKCFRNIKKAPEKNVGLVRVGSDGRTLELLWGFEDGGGPTSELPTHLRNHMTRLRIDPNHKAVMHCHPVNTIAMTFLHELDDKKFTLALWGTCTECVLIFYDGVGIVPWMPAGTNDIAEATAEKMENCRVVIWGQHGIFSTGRDLQETFGLIETVEKAAEIYMKTAGLPILNPLPKEHLKDAAGVYDITIREGFLD